MTKSIYLTPVKSKSRVFSPSRLSTTFKTPSKSLSQQVEDYEFVKGLKAGIDQNREVEDSKQQLALRNDFNALDAFRFGSASYF